MNQTKIAIKNIHNNYNRSIGSICHLQKVKLTITIYICMRSIEIKCIVSLIPINLEVI